ncbi:hypothetical protein BDZ94DRAFT_1254741 [Collybia nuda]|uniref:Uncharacterized protein n=1 Tax=Collybia nuda TaxID=64659 RepID=A0A9P5Y8B1_9AGAR|nr:hypothetical protein BDZ94DRAFT_1254741 [Collybia nuda]
MNSTEAEIFQEREGLVQIPTHPRVYWESPEKKTRPTGGPAQSSVPLDEVQRYIKFTMPGALLAALQVRKGPQEPSYIYDCVESAPPLVFDSDDGYEFEFDLGPCEVLDIKRRVETWLSDPEFIRERESTKRSYRYSSRTGNHSRLPTPSVSKARRGVPETPTGRPIIGRVGRHRRMTFDNFC